MAKRLTYDSLKTKPKFELTLEKEIHERLIKYLILTGNDTKRNEFINNLIKKELDGKVLENSSYIDLSAEPYYFNKNDLLENGKVIATQKYSFHDIDELFVIQLLPNNLDDFNKELETYCVGNNENMHAGYYILPKYKDHDETHFSFLYDSEKKEIEIGIENPNNIDNVFKSTDAETHPRMRGKQTFSPADGPGFFRTHYATPLFRKSSPAGPKRRT